MRVVLDYGGVLVEHADERKFAHLLDIAPDLDPYPGWLAYYLFRTGFLQTHDEYIDLLSTLTGASKDDCERYVERTWLDPEVPQNRREILDELAARHSLVLLSNMAAPWVERVLHRYNLYELFEAVLVSSELKRPKPHPRGYIRSMEDATGTVVMVSDEYNEDLLMANCLGMTTVWLKHSDEEPFREPDHTIDDLESLPVVLEHIAHG